MEITDSQVVNRVRWFVGVLIQYRLTQSPNSLFTVNHISILTATVSTYLIGFLSAYLGCAYAIGVMGRRDTASRLLEGTGAGCLVLCPSLFGTMIIVPWITYGNPMLWSNFTAILAGSIYGVLFGFLEVFVWDGKHFRKLARYFQHSARKETEFSTRDLWRRITVGSIFARMLSAMPHRDKGR